MSSAKPVRLTTRGMPTQPTSVRHPSSGQQSEANHSRSQLGFNEPIQNDPSNLPIDNVAAYPTPEGLMLTLMPAGVMPRLSAWLLDLMIKGLAFFIISIIAVFFGEAGMGFGAIGYFIISWLYPVFFEVYRGGMTPGKKSQRIYVCHDNGTPITLQASMIRNLLRVADFLPFFYVSAVLCVLFNAKSQRIGDIVAGTIVVYHQKDSDSVAKISKIVANNNPVANNSIVANNSTQQNNLAASASQTTEKSPIDNYVLANMPLFYYPLTLSEQQALLAFSERAPFLSNARQLEIASALTPLLSSHETPPALSDAQMMATLQARINRIHGFNPMAQETLAFGQNSLHAHTLLGAQSHLGTNFSDSTNAVNKEASK